MLKRLQSWLRPQPAPPADPTRHRPPAPLVISGAGVGDFEIAPNLSTVHGLPALDWGAVQRWVDGIPDKAEQARAWDEAERAWLAHLRAALGPGCQLRERDGAILLSSQEPRVAEATLAFVNKTRSRLAHLLNGIAQAPAWGNAILLVFDDDDTYYRHLARHYPEAGEFAASGGVYIHDGCGHFATVKADVHAIEPVIAHELTHACLAHLPLPAWLNEGIAVNTEQRLCPARVRAADPRQMHARHRQFWGDEEIQQFWSGKSFLRADDGNELSYDLARIIVSQLSADWGRFAAFVCSAHAQDAGASAAAEHLGLNLGDAVAALLEHAPSPAWKPDPAAWVGEPERGAFVLPSNGLEIGSLRC